MIIKLGAQQYLEEQLKRRTEADSQEDSQSVNLFYVLLKKKLQ